MSILTPPVIIPADRLLPPDSFSNIINQLAIRVNWLKSHLCPCSADQGNADPNCTVCLGRSVFWDPATGPYNVLITFFVAGKSSPIGEVTDSTWGIIFEGQPMLTIPNTTIPVYSQAGLYDVFVEVDNIMRFNGLLRVNQNSTLLHGQLGVTQSLTVATTGAVTVFDLAANVVRGSVPYTVNGANVTLNTVFPEGTGYTVEYQASPLWVIEGRIGGLQHARPFAQLTLPKRFRLNALDLFLRNPLGFSTGVV